MSSRVARERGDRGVRSAIPLLAEFLPDTFKREARAHRHTHNPMKNNQDTGQSHTRYRVGVDVGGTFTDVIAVDGEGAVTFVKTASTPRDQSIGVMNALSLLAERLGLERARAAVAHGAHHARHDGRHERPARAQGGPRGLLTTEGHRDVLEMREGLKPERYDLRLPRPDPLVPRHLRLGVKERVARTAASRFRSTRVVARPCGARAGEGEGALRRGVLSACLAGRPSIERRTREVLADALPGVYVSLSSQVLPQIKEYQRVSTTVVNAMSAR